MPAVKLTAKQSNFVKEYLIDLNATQAAIRAGYSKKTAFRSGQENMQRPAIKAAIQKVMDKRSKKTGITANGVLADIRYLADMCLGRKPTKKAQLFEGVYVEREVLEVNQQGAKAALELLGKHLKLFGADTTAANSGLTINLNMSAGAQQLQIDQGVTVEGEVQALP